MNYRGTRFWHTAICYAQHPWQWMVIWGLCIVPVFDYFVVPFADSDGDFCIRYDRRHIVGHHILNPSQSGSKFDQEHGGIRQETTKAAPALQTKGPRQRFPQDHVEHVQWTRLFQQNVMFGEASTREMKKQIQQSWDLTDKTGHHI